LQTVRNLISTRAHVERTRGTPTEASAYCQAVEWDYKDGRGPVPKRDPAHMDLVYAYGDLQSVPDASVAAAAANQGSRNDILDVKAELDAGRDIWEIAQEDKHFAAVIKYHRGYQQYKHARTEERDFKTTVCVFTGAPGTGKSRAAFNFDNAFVVPMSNGQQWMDGYDPTRHRTVIFDDFHASIPAHQLLRLCDEYPVQYPTKGGFIQFRPEAIIFTSNYPPTSWYDWSTVKADVNAFLRRIDIWWEYFLPETPEQEEMCNDREFHCLAQCKSAVVWHPMLEELVPLPSKNADDLPLYGVPHDEIPTIPIEERKAFLDSLMHPVVVSESESDDLAGLEPPPFQDDEVPEDSQESHISISSESDSSGSSDSE